MSDINTWMGFLSGYSLKILGSLLIFVFGIYMSKILKKYLSKGLQKTNLDATIIKFLENVLYFVLLILVVIFALSNLGVQTASIIAVLGTAGLAIALSLKDSLSNIASGIMIVGMRYFRVGDVIEVSGNIGTVKEIQLFITKMTTFDNKEIIIPNKDIVNGSVINVTANDTRRVEWIFGVGYDEDVKKVKSVLEEILNANTLVLQDPAPLVAVNGLNDFSVDFIVRAWCKKEDYLDLMLGVNESVKIRFDAEGIEIPYPKRELKIIQG